jgi:hypothetical protein
MAIAVQRDGEIFAAQFFSTHENIKRRICKNGKGTLFNVRAPTRDAQGLHLSCLGPRLLLRHQHRECAHLSALGHRKYIF